jgi:hypothetical protein
MRGRHTLAAASGVLCLLLAGCGGSPEPKSLPKPSPSTSAPASPTPPVMPDAAKEKSRAGAITFARHYVKLINFAQSTGRLDELKAVENTGCKSCAQADGYLADLYDSGGSIRGGAFTINTVSSLKNPATGGWLVELGVEFGPQVVDYPSPKPDEHPKGGRLPLNVQVAWLEGEWRVLEWTRGA